MAKKCMESHIYKSLLKLRITLICFYMDLNDRHYDKIKVYYIIKTSHTETPFF